MPIQSPSSSSVSSGSGRTVLWEWNQTDLSQFGTPVDFGTDPITGTVSVASIDISDFATRNGIVFTHPNSYSLPSFGAIYYPIADLTTPAQFVIEFTVSTSNSPAPYEDSQYTGVMLAWIDSSHLVWVGDGSGGQQVSYANGGTDNGLIEGCISNAYNESPGAGMTGGPGCIYGRVMCDIKNPTASSDPAIRILSDQLIRFESTGAFAPLPSGGNEIAVSGWDAGWQVASDIRAPGFVFFEAGSASSSFITDLRILDYYM